MVVKASNQVSKGHLPFPKKDSKSNSCRELHAKGIRRGQLHGHCGRIGQRGSLVTSLAQKELDIKRLQQPLGFKPPKQWGFIYNHHCLAKVFIQIGSTMNLMGVEPVEPQPQG